MDSWQKFNETKLPTKEKFYNNLNMQDIADAEFRHGKRVWRDFELKKIYRRLS